MFVEHAADGAGQFSHFVGFVEAGIGEHAVGVAEGGGVKEESAAEDHGLGGDHLADLHHGVRAGEPGHGDIQKNEISHVAGSFHPVHRFLTIAGGEDLVASTAEKALADVADQRVVIHHQDHFCA